MEIATETINVSSNGLYALSEGKKPLDMWTPQEIKRQVIQIKLSNKPCPLIGFNDLDDVSFEILAKNLLVRREWHHVGFRPCYFYGIDEGTVISLTQAHVDRMIFITQEEEKIRNRPKWTRFCIYRWKTSVSGHQFCDTYIVYGVLYNNTAYFKDGRSMRVIPDKCEVSKIYEKAPKNRKGEYDNIRKKMKSYGIHC